MVINGLYVLYLFCFNRKYTNTRIKGDMKKSIILIIALAFLNACAEYSAFVGPSITMANQEVFCNQVPHLLHPMELRKQ